MKRNLKLFILQLILMMQCVSAEEPAVKSEERVQEKRPNFVWLMSEDNSVHYLDLYNKAGAPTPRINELAKDGVVFNHAFSVAAVCS